MDKGQILMSYGGSCSLTLWTYTLFTPALQKDQIVYLFGSSSYPK